MIKDALLAGLIVMRAIIAFFTLAFVPAVIGYLLIGGIGSVVGFFVSLVVVLSIVVYCENK